MDAACGEMDCFVASLPCAMTLAVSFPPPLTAAHSPRYAFRTSGLTLISAALPCISTRPVCRM